jgi:O-antigen/teichoic acid export membrane protein
MNTSRRWATLATLTGSSTNTLIISIQAVVLIPLYLNAIGPRLYGAWLGSGDILIWIYAFDLGLPNLMIQRIGAAHGRGDPKSVAEYFATGLVVLALVALAIALVAVLLSFPLPAWMGLSGAEAQTLRWCFIVGSIATAFNLFNNSIVGFSRGIQNTTFMNVVGIISSLAGFAVSLGLILTGWGLWAVAFGLVARSGVSIMGSAIFVIRSVRGDLYRFFRVQWSILHEFVVVSPVTALGGISYAVMNQSEAALVAIFLKPELAVVLTLTRKALDVARGLVDMIAFASYGGFAHLVSSDQRHRTLQVYAEINSLRLSLAVALAAAYMAVNASLLSVWTGSAQYGGAWLTILMAVQFIVVGGAFLINYLYRATGPIMKGSMALLVESMVRVPLMIGLLLWLGLPGVPIAGIVTAGIFGWLAYRWLLKEVLSFSEPLPRFSAPVWVGRAIIFSVGMLLCMYVRWETWTYVLVVGSAITFMGSAVLIYVDPVLSTVRASLTALFSRLRLAAVTARG